MDYVVLLTVLGTSLTSLPVAFVLNKLSLMKDSRFVFAAGSLCLVLAAAVPAYVLRRRYRNVDFVIYGRWYICMEDANMFYFCPHPVPADIVLLVNCQPFRVFKRSVVDLLSLVADDSRSIFICSQKDDGSLGILKLLSFKIEVGE